MRLWGRELVSVSLLCLLVSLVTAQYQYYDDDEQVKGLREAEIADTLNVTILFPPPSEFYSNGNHRKSKFYCIIKFTRSNIIGWNSQKRKRID